MSLKERIFGAKHKEPDLGALAATQMKKVYESLQELKENKDHISKDLVCTYLRACFEYRKIINIVHNNNGSKGLDLSLYEKAANLDTQEEIDAAIACFKEKLPEGQDYRAFTNPVNLTETTLTFLLTINYLENLKSH